MQVFIDSIIGPTYHYGGLSFGNVHSMAHQQDTVSPKMAALNGLNKMKCVADLGIPQYVLPPQIRDFHALIATHASSPQHLYTENLAQFSAIFSASAAWTANAFTATASCDSSDNMLHVTPANLMATPHRRLEVTATCEHLKRLFQHSAHCVLHDPISSPYSDEGAANMMYVSELNKGIYVFVYGKGPATSSNPTRFPARQDQRVYDILAQEHKLADDGYMCIQQHPNAIDAGVFHNDVIAFGLNNVLVVHEDAYLDQKRVLKQLNTLFFNRTGSSLHIISISNTLLSLNNAVKNYFFNSQLCDMGNGSYTQNKLVKYQLVGLKALLFYYSGPINESLRLSRWRTLF